MRKSIEKQNGKADILSVANAARVSASTVSRSFNHPSLVKLSTRKRIDRAVKKLGYIRNRVAQTMHGKRSGTIGLITPTLDHTIFAELMQAFSTAVQEAEFTILTASHEYDLDREYQLLRKFLEHRVDGIALIGLEHVEPTFQLIEQQRIPALSIWNYAPEHRISCIGVDNLKAGRIAAEHIVQLGHREIGIIFPSTAGNDRAHDRHAGVIEVLANAGVAMPRERNKEVPYSLMRSKAVAMELLDRCDRPTAILCGNDVIAQGTIYAALALGLLIPDELSIIGIGDFKGSGAIEPGLTTVRIPARSMGTLAGHRLAQTILQEKLHPESEKFDHRLVTRATTAPPRV